MRAAWRVADIRAAEEALMRTLPDATLMQRAATGLAVRCASLLDGVYGKRVVVLAGTGNNGGDALYAGAQLARRGARVEALLLDQHRVHRGGLDAFRDAGGRVTSPDPAPDLAIDGIFGIGGRGALPDRMAAAVNWLAAPITVAVDVPSGVDADTGTVRGAAVRAAVTVTFGALKPGLLVGAGAVHSGLVEFVDIGLRPWLAAAPALHVPEQPDVAGRWPRPHAGDDKYTRGVVGIAAGSSMYPGAAVLAVAGALAGPTGMVRYAGAAADAVRVRHPSTVVTERVADAGRVQAWVCGSGLGTDARGEDELRAVLGSPVPVCLDADALSLLATRPVSLNDRDAPTVLTPHDREFARLAGGQPGADRVRAAQHLATTTRTTVLLKGDRTVVAAPDGRAYVNPTGTPVLASGGTGDVLAGLLGSLLASGMRAEDAAWSAAYLHGLAGRIAAKDGPVTAAHVAGALRAAVRTTVDG
jgi:hydroxyethylthiazole kinase-like uncharacterized protein yjeF